MEGNRETDSGKRAGIHFPGQFYGHGSSTSTIHGELNCAVVAEWLIPEMEEAPQLSEFGSKGDIYFRVLRFGFLCSELSSQS